MKQSGMVLLAALVVALSIVPGILAQEEVDEFKEIPREFDEFKYCFDFEYLPLHQVYVVGDSFAVTRAKVAATEFEWSSGGISPDGKAIVDNNHMAGGWGYDINTNNINLLFEPEEPIPGLVLLYGEYGGNLNLAINGDPANFEDFPDIDGSNLGGVEIRVIPFTDELGALVMIGDIENFSIGGQELWIDDACEQEFMEEGCITFEPFQVGAPPYKPGDTLYEAGVGMAFQSFKANSTIVNGTAMIDDRNLAGDKGNDLNANNINVQFPFPRPAIHIHLFFGEYGGNLNFDINGEFIVIDNFADIDGANIGGANIAVSRGSGNGLGEIEIEGEIKTMTIGGQELWIDTICWVAPA